MKIMEIKLKIYIYIYKLTHLYFEIGKRERKKSLYSNHLSIVHSRGTNGKRMARRFRRGLVMWCMVVRRRHIHQKLFLIIFIVFEKLNHLLSTFIK
jgi:hypothetical protein